MDRELRDAFGEAPLRDRLHLRLRWSSCPLTEVAAFVPSQGRILEIGCGHGLFCAYLAKTSIGRDVYGIDVDARKVAIAQRAARRIAVGGARMRAEWVASGSLPPGPWDSVVIVDVLYLLAADEQQRLITAAADSLAPGGRLVVKETALRPSWKFRLTLLQELVSVKIAHVTSGRDLSFVGPTAIAAWMRTDGLVVEEHSLAARRLHPHAMIVGDRV